MKYPRAIACVFTGGLMLTCLATPASAISVGIVGSVDNFLASTALSSNGKAQEEAWVSGVLGFVTTIVYKDDVTADATAVQGIDTSASPPPHQAVAAVDADQHGVVHCKGRG